MSEATDDFLAACKPHSTAHYLKVVPMIEVQKMVDEHARLTSERDALQKALRPFAAAHFNDNGMISTSTGHLTPLDYWNARDAIASVEANHG